MRTRTRIRHTDTANRIATCSDSKRIRTQNARSIHRSDVDTWGFSSSVAWQRFEVVPNVIGPTSSTCERVVHQPAVVHYYVFCVFPSILYNKCSLPALHHNYSLPPSIHPSLPPRPLARNGHFFKNAVIQKKIAVTSKTIQLHIFSRSLD